MWRGPKGVDKRQLAWLLMRIVSGASGPAYYALSLWLISRLGPVVQALSSWAHAAMPVVATLLSVAILLWAGSHPDQLLFHAAWEKMMAQNSPATYR